MLGRLDADNFLGGEMTLAPERADQALTDLAESLGVDKHEAAEGVLTIVNSNMANAIRSKTVQKGLDPRDFSLVAFGGAGPLHGAEVAAMLDVPEVVVPPHPGITSAAGLLTTDLKYDQIMTAFQVKGAVDIGRINSDFARLSRDLLAQYEAAGLGADRVEERRAGDLRYVGQGYELRVAFPADELDEAGLEEVWQAFHALHEQEYGHCFTESPIEIVNIRITGVGRMPKIAAPPAPAGGSLEEARVKTARSVFRVDGTLEGYETAFYRREALPVDAPFAGPAIIVQKDATTVVPPGWSVRVDTSANLILRLGEED